MTRRVLNLLILLCLCISCHVPNKREQGVKPFTNWPPRIIYNTDGNWVFNYLKNRDPKDLTVILDALQGTAVDIVTVLVGIDDDLSWRGSDHGQMWGDNIKNWDPDGDEARPSVGGMDMSAVQRLHQNLAAVTDDGHDLLKIYIDRAQEVQLGIFASFRMNDGHGNYEDRGWYGRSIQKMERTDLLIGSPAGWRAAARSDEWNFAWQWDYAHEEVRNRFLGLFDEVLTRYEFNGLELDFIRQPPFFKSGQGSNHTSTMTDFIRATRRIVLRHKARKGQEIKLIVRVPPSIDHSRELGIDTEAWIREGLVDAVVMASVGSCSQQIDIHRAVQTARESGVLIYTGFDSRPQETSPQGGYDNNPVTVLRGAALNGYKQGASGVHLFNHGYISHRKGPVPNKETKLVAKPVGTDLRGFFTSSDLQDLKDLGNSKALESLSRCYYADTRLSNYHGDYPPQVPAKLALIGRGAGIAHAIRIRVEDDIAGGLSDGRIQKTELRLRLTHTEKSFDRVRCQVNGIAVDLTSAARIRNQRKNQWLVIDNPPVKSGVNTVLVVLEGTKSPAEYTKRNDPWPTLESCEIIVKGGR